MLAREYGEVLVERVWLVATERIPELVAQLEAIIPRPPGEYPGHNTTFLKPLPDS